MERDVISGALDIQEGTPEAEVLEAMEQDIQEWLAQGGLSALRSLDGGHAGGCG